MKKKLEEKETKEKKYNIECTDCGTIFTIKTKNDEYKPSFCTFCGEELSLIDDEDAEDDFYDDEDLEDIDY